MTATAAQIDIATAHGLQNAALAALAAATVGLPFHAACALLEKESGGKNVWGADRGGTFSRLPGDVTEELYRAFRWEVITRGRQSNGVGPCQLTYRGFFLEMEKQGLKPWVPGDNMLYGFRLLAGYYRASKSWRTAGRKYNGSLTYGRDLAKKVDAWKTRLG